MPSPYRRNASRPRKRAGAATFALIKSRAENAHRKLGLDSTQPDEFMLQQVRDLLTGISDLCEEQTTEEL